MRQRNQFPNKNLLLIITLLLVSIGVLIIWRQNSPFPNVMSWDIYAHQTIFNQLAKGNLHPLPSQISDTFLLDTYTPLFAILVGLGKYLFPSLSLPGYYFILSSIHFMSTVFLSAYFGWMITKDRWITLFSGTLGALVFESTIAQTAFFLLPQTLSATLVIIALILWMKEKRDDSLPILALATALHIIIGGVGCLIIGVSWLLQRITPNNRSKGYRAAMLAGLLLVILIILLNPHLTLDPLSTLESAELNLTLKVKSELAQRWYGWLGLFYLIGLLAAWRSKKSNLQLISVLSLMLLGLALLPMPHTLKSYTVGRYLIHLTMALGIGAVILRFQKFWVRLLLFLLLLTTQMVVFYYNQYTFKQAIVYGEVVTTASNSEWEAAEFLRKEYGDHPSAMIVSDPSTQHVIEGLSGINSQGGAFATEKTRLLVDETYPNDSPKQVKNLLLEIKDGLSDSYPSKVLFLVSGRYISWQNLAEEIRYDVSYNIWGARDLTLEGLRFAQTLEQTPDFKEVFRNQAMVILEIER